MDRATTDRALNVHTNANILNNNNVTCCIYFKRRRKKLNESKSIGNIPAEQTEKQSEQSPVEVVESKIDQE